MALSQSPSKREPLHTRSITVRSYGRDDGLWDLEAELIDTKAYDFPTRSGAPFVAGRHLHHMHLRVTIDADFLIVAAEAAYDAAPYDQECFAIDSAYEGLVGLNLLKNFRGQVKARFGRTEGCTHMTELGNVLPTVAVQTMANQRRVKEDDGQRPFQLDGCHALRTDGPTVLHFYPKWYTGAEAQDSLPHAEADSRVSGASSASTDASTPSAVGSTGNTSCK